MTSDPKRVPLVRGWSTARLAMVVATLAGVAGFGLARVSAGTPQAPAATQPSDGYYTERQAKRGQGLFNRNCALCHLADSTPMAEAIQAGRGIKVGANRALLPLGGNYLKKTFEGHPDYPSVYYLFNRIRESMPAWGANTVGIDDKVDIVAYLLQANGLPPGPRELKADVPAMKRMRLTSVALPAEPGFETLFNGRDFTNFKFLLGPNCRPAPEGCGKSDPGSVYRVDEGEIVCTGKIQGYMYTEKKYLNFTLRFDYRFQPPADWEAGDDVVFYGNSGYFLFINDHQVFPKGLQVEGYHRLPLILFPMDTKAKSIERVENRKMALKPLGEWNSVEIVSKDGQVNSSLNGVLLSTITEHEFRQPGAIGFEAEGSEIHWRNIRIKPE
jgi:mono/diheme cytochrome c family protein